VAAGRSKLRKERVEPTNDVMKPQAPVGLKCEYLADPLGIAAPSPRFAWIPVSSRRGAKQMAYQIIVSPDSGFIVQEVGDYWDSGRVDSPRTSDLAYAGEPLWSGKTYYWRVRWWDDEGHVSPYSESASFEMGLLQQRDWKAQWISRREPPEFRSKANMTLGETSGEFVQSLGIYLRKEFNFQGKVRKARAYVCGLGYYELRLNGKKVGDHVLDPAQTDYRKIALYSIFDITDRIEGRNAVAVILGNGRHIKNYGYGPPRLILQLHIERENDLIDRVITDTTWTASGGPLLENGIYSGNRYDARLEQAGWDEPGFDDSHWEAAIAVEGANLAPQAMPPIRVTERLRPVETWSPGPGVHIFDFGQNFSGWVRLKVRGPRGREIRLRHAELIHPDGTLNVLPNQNAEATDIFVLGGKGEGAFEPRFTYHGFRYAEIAGFPGEPGLESVEGCRVHSDVEKIGHFECSHGLLNRIHQNIVRGQLANLMSIPTDCPQRDERQGWLGDAHLSAEEAMLNFDMAAFYSKFLEDIRLAQKDDGSLPDTVPPYITRLYPADPAWGMAYLEIGWLMYFYCGDERVLLKHYVGMKKYVDFLSRNADNYIIRKLGKYGDWCPPKSVGPKKTPLELTATWCYFRAASLLSRFAEVLGRADDARDYAKLAGNVGAAFNAQFLENDQYAATRLSPADKSPSQTSNVLPLAADMVPKEIKPRVLESLLRSVIRECDYHFDTGVLGTKYILDVLTENGYGEAALRVVTQKSYPGWGYMVENGATTLWERWEYLTGDGMNSHNHIMFGSVDAWFYKTVAGLRCLEPGWRKMKVKPPLFRSLDHAAAKVNTVRGEAGVSWRREDGRFELSVRVPIGTEAEIHLPAPFEGRLITEGETVIRERAVAEAKSRPRTELKSEQKPAEISIARREGQYVVINVGSGTYQFASLESLR
jgi:alpha-L-rhamnosidase